MLVAFFWTIGRIIGFLLLLFFSVFLLSLLTDNTKISMWLYTNCFPSIITEFELEGECVLSNLIDYDYLMFWSFFIEFFRRLVWMPDNCLQSEKVKTSRASLKKSSYVFTYFCSSRRRHLFKNIRVEKSAYSDKKSNHV